MLKIKSVTFTQLIHLPGYSLPELNKVEDNKINIEMEDRGVILTWNECDPHDAHVDISKNPICKVFVPIHMIKQVTYEKEVSRRQTIETLLTNLKTEKKLEINDV